MTTLALVPAPPTRPPLIVLNPPEAAAAVQAPLPLHEPDAVVAATPEVGQREEATVHAITRALCEALAGRRPLSQVRPLLAPRVALLVDHLHRARVAVGRRVGTVLVQSPAAGVLEASVLLPGPGPLGVAALRLELRDRRWSITALETALGPDVRRPARA